MRPSVLYCAILASSEQKTGSISMTDMAVPYECNQIRLCYGYREIVPGLRKPIRMGELIQQVLLWS